VNRETRPAREYHDVSKHQPERTRTDRFRPDLHDPPSAYKRYSDLPVTSLPAASDSTGVRALAAISPGQSSLDGSKLDLSTLSSLLRYTAGTVKQLRYAGGVMEFRAAASTGAQYHIELYLVCRDLPGLQAGAYHFDPQAAALTLLRQGDWRSAIAGATGGEESAKRAEAVVVCTSVVWRNAWRYRERAYRHCFWDSGTMVANLLSLASAHAIPHRLVTGFVDESIAALLDIDGSRELTTCLVTLGRDEEPVERRFQAPERLGLRSSPPSRHEIDYPIIPRTHRAGSLASRDEVRAWRSSKMEAVESVTPSTGVILQTIPAADSPALPIEEIIRRRRSARRFSADALDPRALGTLLRSAMGEIPADYGTPAGSELFLILNAVRGVEPGLYRYHAASARLELLRVGDFRETSAMLALDQSRAGEAAVNAYFLANLDHALERWGNRAYRVLQLDAAIRAGRLYLGAYALGLGATGLTFYDDEVIRSFAPASSGLDVMFLMAFGIPARRSA
jgi:SagB-type dehydrogenase family enzyme